MKDKFYIAGRVHPSEWDWKKGMENLAKMWKRNPSAYIQFDAGKLFGLVSALEDAEQELSTALSLSAAYREIIKRLVREYPICACFGSHECITCSASKALDIGNKNLESIGEKG